jgi:transposase
MMLREMSMQIKWLAGQGVQKARIAAQLNVSRQTVYNHLQRGDEPFPKRRGPRSSKLDGFKGYIRSRLENFDLPATVLLREVRAQGYCGGLTVLRDFVRPLRKELIRRVTERFETVPGQQMGLSAVGAISFYVAVLSGLTLVTLLALYPLATLFGGVPLPRFARAVVLQVQSDVDRATHAQEERHQRRRLGRQQTPGDHPPALLAHRGDRGCLVHIETDILRAPLHEGRSLVCAIRIRTAARFPIQVSITRLL